MCIRDSTYGVHMYILCTYMYIISQFFYHKYFCLHNFVSQNILFIRPVPKTEAQRSKQYRAQKKLSQAEAIASRPVPKTEAQRSKEYRARKKLSQAEAMASTSVWHSFFFNSLIISKIFV